MKKLEEFNKKVRSAKKMPELQSGDIVKVHRKIKEGEKERVQVFEGIVIAIKGRQSSSPMMTVRRVAHGTGIEITVPIYSPTIEKIEKIKKANTRKAKLYYLREKGFKLSKLKMKDLGQFVVEEEKEEKIEDIETEPTIEKTVDSETKKESSEVKSEE